MSDSTKRRPSPVWLNSLPSARFDAQVKQELHRIRHQLLHPQMRRVVPYDPFASSVDNAISNVRSRWQSQGIWRKVWGLDPRSVAFEPLDAWPHEIHDEVPSSASRPYQQFHIEVMAELESIITELEYRGLEVVDLVPFRNALTNVRERWMQDGIWNPLWVVTPGTMWLHEQLPAECDPRLVGCEHLASQLRRDMRHLGEPPSPERIIPDQHAQDVSGIASSAAPLADVNCARHPVLYHIPADVGNQHLPEAHLAELPCQQSANSTYMPPPDDPSELPPTPRLAFLPTPQSATPCTEIQHPRPVRVATPELLRIPTPSAFMSSSEDDESHLHSLQLANSRNCQRGQVERPHEQHNWSKTKQSPLNNGPCRDGSRPQSLMESSQTGASSPTSIKSDSEHFEAGLPGERIPAHLVASADARCHAPEVEPERRRRRRRPGSRKSESRSGKPRRFEICFSWGGKGRSKRQISLSWF